MKKRWVVAQAVFAVVTLLGLCQYFWKTSAVEMATNGWFFPAVMLICIVVFAMFKFYISMYVLLSTLLFLSVIQLLVMARLHTVPFIGVPATFILALVAGAFVVTFGVTKIISHHDISVPVEIESALDRFLARTIYVAFVACAVGVFIITCVGFNAFYGNAG